MKIRQTKWIIALSMVAIGLAIVITTTLPQSTKYYVTVDELYLDPQKYENEAIKVAGKVAANSIQKQETTWSFLVTNNGKNLQVTYKGAMPDTFKEGAEVVVEGKYRGSETFVATNVLAKCASRYEEKLTPTLHSPSGSEKI